ncbi:cadherin-like domain-containing protein, partial [Microcoleus sp. A2-D5]|uniref:cadherin-like domain-containing protein n=1 Tax=Microcoleus sp. A2-D5 TaxID=2818538 RepID=UPI002FD30EA9
GPYDNTATIDGNENDPDPSDDSDTEIVTPNNYTYAIDDINTSLINTPVTGNVLTNDFDLEGNTQTIASNTNPSNGTVVMNPDGTYTYTPNSGFTGTDSFTYTVCDNGTPIACSTATVTINVEETIISSSNNDLVANNDAVITENGTTITIAVLSNDFDPDNNTFVITPGSVTDPANGTVVVNPDGTITYTPDPGYEGEDTFTYQICDNGSPVSCETATVIVTVLPNSSSNTTYAIDDSYFINCSSNSTMNLLDNDYDLESDLQTINTTPVVQPLHGTVTINTDGTFNYTANPCYAGPDSFVYQVCDNGSPQACDVATVYLLIQDTTDPTFVEALPADATVQCDAIPAAVTLTATDNCGT